MALSPRLDLRQSQSLVMTPQLQQAIKLLALSNLEVEAYIANELERNPLLEVAGGGEPEGADAVPAQADQISSSSSETASDRMLRDDAPADGSPLDMESGGDGGHDVDTEGPARNEGSGGTGQAGDVGMASAASGDGPDFDSFAGGALGLHEHLMEQARLRLSGQDLVVAGQIIGQIDGAGYLEVELLQIAYALQVPKAEVEAVLKIVQTFDPTGVGARSLGECLALQAKEADRYDPAMAALIDNLDLLARGALSQLRRICGVDEEDLSDMIRELRGYDPKPGLKYAEEESQTIIPDIIVTPRGDGWAVEVNGATLPRVLVNRVYYAELSGGVQDKTSRAWLSDCLASANWLVKALDQRQKTIVKVAAEIVRCQEPFFLRGVAHLKPLTLRAVAEAVNLHESTVSRVTSNKYLSCPRGLFELKYFFTSGIASADGGEAVSAEAVKSRIKALISAEDPHKILSDDTLVDMLRAESFDIARRTVAKYREAIGIGSSVQRRRQKALVN